MNNKGNLLFGLIRGFAAIAVALFVALVFIILCSDEPMTAMEYLLIRPLISMKGGVASFNTNAFYTILAAMIPTIFAGLAVCVMFSANQFNLAGEGCVMLGGFVGALCGIYIHMNTGLHALLCVAIAMVICGIVMLVPAVLKVKLGASEMVSSLMLNYVIMYIVLHFLNNVFMDSPWSGP